MPPQILPVGRAESEEAALLRARARRAGHVLRLADAVVASCELFKLDSPSTAKPWPALMCM